jgi:hypothetical protein
VHWKLCEDDPTLAAAQVAADQQAQRDKEQRKKANEELEEERRKLDEHSRAIREKCKQEQAIATQAFAPWKELFRRGFVPFGYAEPMCKKLRRIRLGCVAAICREFHRISAERIAPMARSGYITYLKICHPDAQLSCPEQVLTFRKRQYVMSGRGRFRIEKKCTPQDKAVSMKL